MLNTKNNLDHFDKPILTELQDVGLFIYGTHTMSADGALNIDGMVFFANSTLKKLPVRFGIVSGDFCAYEGALTTLENSPTEVGGTYSVSENKLKSLVGCPRKVGNNFNCFNNKLENLDGAPEEVDGNFYCHINPLKSLEGFNCRIGQFFYGPESLCELVNAERLDDFDRKGKTALRVPGAYIQTIYQARELQRKLLSQMPQTPSSNAAVLKI